MIVEEKKNERLLKYWEGLRKGRIIPSEDDIDPDELEGLWDNCFLMQFRDIDNVEHCNYTYLGEGIRNAYQRDRIPYPIDGLVYVEANHMAAQFRKVREIMQPMISSGKHEMPDGKIIKYHQCLLPLGYDDNSVHSIIGRMGYEIYPDIDTGVV